MAHLKEMPVKDPTLPLTVKSLEVVYIRTNSSNARDKDLSLFVGLVLLVPEETTLETLELHADLGNRILVTTEGSTSNYATSRIESLTKHEGAYFLATQNANFKVVFVPLKDEPFWKKVFPTLK